jgi:hypothetical protein
MALRDFQLKAWIVYMVSDHTECALCTWVFSPSMGEEGKPFVLKFVNRQCREHGKDLPLQ